MPALIPPDEPPLAPLPALQGWSPSALVAALAGALLALLALLVSLALQVPLVPPARR